MARGRGSRWPASRIAWLVVLGLQIAWGLWFVWRTTFAVDGVRTFCLFDDAMTSMTYARNLVEGHGLVWARFGAPVEGFTCPLWTFLMVPVHLLPLGPQRTSLVVQLLSLALLVLNVVAAGRLARAHFSPAGAGLVGWLPAVVLTALYYPLHHWALQGMETGLQALLVTLAVLLSLDLAAEERPPGRRPYGALAAVLAAAYLTRMDMALLVVLALAFVAWRRGFPRARWRRWLPGLGLLAIAVAGYQLFRWLYFGDVLPNTYYLKLTGVPLDVRLLRGLWTLGRFLLPLAPVLAVIAAGLPALLRRDRRPLLPVAVVLAYLAYSAWVGGDAWEEAGVGANRFVAFVMPLVFVLFNAVLSHAVTRGWRDRRRLGTAAATLATAAALLLANQLWPLGPREGWRRFLVLERPLLVDGHERFVRRTLHLQASGLIPPGGRVAVVWSGIPAYFSDWEMVDLLGYNDRWVARQASSIPLTRASFRAFRPGHGKLGYEHALRVHRPDLVFQTWRPDGEDWSAELRRHGYRRRGAYWVHASATSGSRPRS
jgi:hypothetical protein